MTATLENFADLVQMALAEAQPPQLLTGGDLSRYLFVDRDGDLVRISAAGGAG